MDGKVDGFLRVPVRMVRPDGQDPFLKGPFRPSVRGPNRNRTRAPAHQMQDQVMNTEQAKVPLRRHWLDDWECRSLRRFSDTTRKWAESGITLKVSSFVVESLSTGCPALSCVMFSSSTHQIYWQYTCQ